MELKKSTMFLQGIRSSLGVAAYKIKRDGVTGLVRSLKHSKAIGVAMPGLGTDTLDRRRINPYRIEPEDRDVLLGELLPYWNGRTIAGMLRQRFRESDLYEGEFGDFLQSVELALEGVVIYAQRLTEKLQADLDAASDPERRAVLSEMLAACRRVPLYPAETFREALQSYWTVKTAVELAIPFNVHSPGRLDQLFFRYYEADLAAGCSTREEARELLEAADRSRASLNFAVRIHEN